MLIIDKMEQKETKWAFQYYFPRKTDGSIPFCGDYKILNAIAISYLYCISSMNEGLDALYDAINILHATKLLAISRSRSTTQINIRP